MLLRFPVACAIAMAASTFTFTAPSFGEIVRPDGTPDYSPGGHTFEPIPGVIGEIFTWNHGATHSTSSGWNLFEGTNPISLPHTDSTPDVTGQVGTPSSLTVNANSVGTFFTGGGNLYSFGGVQDFTSTINSGTSGGSFTRIVAQFRTLGSELDRSSILLSSDLGVEGTVAPNFTLELARIPFGGFGGDQVDLLALWDLDSSQDAFRLDFNSVSSSLSLDRFYVDTFTQSGAFSTPAAVPEPATWVAMGLATGVFVTARQMRRRRRRTTAAKV